MVPQLGVAAARDCDMGPAAAQLSGGAPPLHRRQGRLVAVPLRNALVGQRFRCVASRCCLLVIPSPSSCLLSSHIPVSPCSFGKNGTGRTVSIWSLTAGPTYLVHEQASPFADSVSGVAWSGCKPSTCFGVSRSGEMTAFAPTPDWLHGVCREVFCVRMRACCVVSVPQVVMFNPPPLLFPRLSTSPCGRSRGRAGGGLGTGASRWCRWPSRSLHRSVDTLVAVPERGRVTPAAVAHLGRRRPSRWHQR